MVGSSLIEIRAEHQRLRPHMRISTGFRAGARGERQAIAKR
jgi:hypothetical protein